MLQDHHAAASGARLPWSLKAAAFNEMALLLLILPLGCCSPCIALCIWKHM